MGRIYWLDRCLCSERLIKALTKHGVDLRLYKDLYPNATNVPDATWIPQVAGNNWVILTKDRRITRHPVELAALTIAAGQYVGFANANMTGQEQADVLVHHWKTIDGIVQARKRRPLIVTVSRDHVKWWNDRKAKANKKGEWRYVQHKP